MLLKVSSQGLRREPRDSGTGFLSTALLIQFKAGWRASWCYITIGGVKLTAPPNTIGNCIRHLRRKLDLYLHFFRENHQFTLTQKVFLKIIEFKSHLHGS